MAKTESGEYYNGLIVNVGGKDRFLEFLDGMKEPFPKDYAMLQGAIGAKYAGNAGIRMSITEYGGADNKLTGSGSALIPTHIFSEIDEVCLKNLSRPVVSDELRLSAVRLSRLHEGVKTLADEGVKAAAEIVKGSEPSVPKAIGKVLKLANYALHGYEADGRTPAPSPAILSPILGYDYEYFQTRIHSEQRRADGACHIVSASIKRQSTMPNSKTGRPDLAKSPWLMSVVTFYAIPSNTATGGESYNPGTVRDRSEVTFRATDRDMHRCAEAVGRFIREWDASILSLFIKGREETEYRKSEYRSRQAERYVC